MPLRRSSVRTIATASAGTWLVVLVALAIEVSRGVDRAAWLRIGLLTVAGIGATVMIRIFLGRQAGRLAEIERVARAIGTAEISRAGDRPRVSIAHERSAEAGEFAPVYEALDELAGRVERQLKAGAKNERNLGAIIDAMDEPLIATDNNERVLLCNRSAEAMLGTGEPIERGALVGRPIGEVFTQEEVLALHGAARAGQSRRRRIRMTTPLGQRVLQVSALPVPAAWGNGVFGAVMILRDVTELEQAVQVKADFVANASHELRTPVSAIRMAAETLKDASREDPEMAERTAGMILSHALRLEDLLRDLLDLSRLEAADVQLTIGPVEPGSLESSMREQFADMFRERRLELVFELGDDLRGMRTDARLLALILRNLIENACKFAFEGTAIRVRAKRIGRATGPDSVPTHSVARFEVIDRGVGIPLAHIERVFERFYQVDAARTGPTARRGTGLGLAIVKHAARALKGRAGLDSTWGEGTTAWVEIPVSFERPEA